MQDVMLNDSSCNTASVSQANSRRVLFLAREGRFSHAMSSLNSQGCAPYDDIQAMDELRDQHPHHSLPDRNGTIPPPLVVSRDSVLTALH